MKEKVTDTFVYEGIVDEHQGNTLCIKYKPYEVERQSKGIQRAFTFFSKYKQKGTIRLSDDDIKKLIPYSMEGQKVRVTIQLIDY